MELFFLNFFFKKNKKLNLYGIDPSAGKFEKYYRKNINLIVDYFSKESLKIEKKFDLITSFAMFYDIGSQINSVQILIIC